MIIGLNAAHSCTWVVQRYNSVGAAWQTREGQCGPCERPVGGSAWASEVFLLEDIWQMLIRVWSWLPWSEMAGPLSVESTANAKCFNWLATNLFWKVWGNGEVPPKFEFGDVRCQNSDLYVWMLFECYFFSCIRYSFTHHIYYVLLFFLNRLIKGYCGLILVVIFYRFVSSLCFKKF